MNHIYLERHDAEKNMHRFYNLFVIPGVFGDWSLIKEWGRVGSPGTVRKEWFDDIDKAISAATLLANQKRRRGYEAGKST